VKHFRFEHRGKRRIHQRPTLGQTVACRPWLTAELAMIKPEGMVLLGSLAGQSLLGADYRVGDHRGQFIDLPDSPDLPDTTAWALATIHPSAALRAEDRAAIFAGLVDDLRLAAERLETSGRT
jgi:uracil-DNA glycosylase